MNRFKIADLRAIHNLTVGMDQEEQEVVLESLTIGCYSCLGKFDCPVHDRFSNMVKICNAYMPERTEAVQKVIDEIKAEKKRGQV